MKMGFMNVKGFDDSAPEVSFRNMRKLKSAYRHPFEYINPRLYQERPESEVDLHKDKFFVDNEDEYNVLQEPGTSTTVSNRDEDEKVNNPLAFFD